VTIEPVALTVERRDATTIVELAGEIDLSTAAETKNRIEDSIDLAEHVVLDLGGLTYLDSAGLAMVDTLFRRCRDRSCAFGLVVPNDSVVRLALAVSGLDTIIAVHVTRDDALSGAGDGAPG
jgi:anti-sigma B factor antagonist